jgi:hypothetical protein
VSLRPEIVLPPGCSVRIDYDPDRGQSSLTVRAFRDGAWVGSAHLSPRLAHRDKGLQRVIDVLTRRGAASVPDGGAEAEFEWPPEAEPRRAEREQPPREPAAPLPERAEERPPRPMPTSAPRWEAPSSEVFALRADMDLETHAHASTPSTGNVLVRLPNGTAVVLPGAPPDDPSPLRDRAVATTVQLVQTVRRHAEDLIAAAQLLSSWRVGEAGNG